MDASTSIKLNNTYNPKMRYYAASPDLSQQKETYLLKKFASNILSKA